MMSSSPIPQSSDEYASCSGQLQSISKLPNLFSILSTLYGGDGKDTFSLPDLRGRKAIGADQGLKLSPRVLGT